VAPTTRELWQAVEGIHAVVYFAPEVPEALAEAGIKGWWRGYFAGRAAPMGRVGPAVVAATFAGFAPAMVERNIPSAWAQASPAAVLAARAQAVQTVLTRIDAPDGAVAEGLGTAADLLDRAADAVATLGRPLAAAWAAHRRRLLAAAELPVGLRAWLAATVLREHRGDAHVAALAQAGLDGCEAHVVLSATGRVPAAMLREARGWSEQDWDAAVGRLTDRGLLRSDGGLTVSGLGSRVGIEDATDRAAAVPWAVLDDDERTRAVAALAPVAAAVVERVPVRVPNPMGWEPPGSAG
jgi:hypothetical protein